MTSNKQTFSNKKDHRGYYSICKSWQTGGKGKILTFIQAIAKLKLKDAGFEKMVGNINHLLNDRIHTIQV